MGRGNLALSKIVIIAALLAVGVAAFSRAPVGAQEPPQYTVTLLNCEGFNGSSYGFPLIYNVTGGKYWVNTTGTAVGLGPAPQRCEFEIDPPVPNETVISISCQATDMYHPGSISQFKFAFRLRDVNGSWTGFNHQSSNAVMNGGAVHTLFHNRTNDVLAVDRFMLEQYMKWQSFWQCDYNDPACTAYRYRVDCGPVLIDGVSVEPVSMCADGTELLTSGPVVVTAAEPLTLAALLTDTLRAPTAQIRYTLAPPTLPISGVATLQQDAEYPFNHISSTTVISTVIPAGRPFQLRPVAQGYELDFELESTGADFTALSVCLLEAEPLELCADGFELIEAGPVVVERGGEEFTWSGRLPYNGFALRYYLVNPNPGGTQIYATTRINAQTWRINGGAGVEVLTATIPTAGAIAGPNLDLALNNTYDTFEVHSICAIPRVQRPNMSGCTHFYDFTEGIDPWIKVPGTGANWAADEENGALRIIGDGYGGDATAMVQIPDGNWQMYLSARSYDDPVTLTFGLVGATWPYTDSLYTAQVGSAYTLLQASGVVSGFAQIQGEHTFVDWVCLVNSNAGTPGFTPLPIPDCGVFPGFDDHPEFSITQIGEWIYWLARKIYQILLWVICQIIRALNSAANWIIERIYALVGWLRERLDLLPELPELPDNLFDVRAWLEWFRQAASIIMDWFSRSGRNMLSSIRRILIWWRDAIYGVINWLAAWWLRGVEVMVNHLLALLGIGAEVDLVGLWRDGRIFLRNIWLELGYEFDSLMTLLDETGEVLNVLIIGWRGSLDGNAEVDFGENMGGLGGFLWRGVNWVGEAIEGTPLTALNFVAMGVLAWGLILYTGQSITRMLEKLFGLD